MDHHLWPLVWDKGTGWLLVWGACLWTSMLLMNFTWTLLTKEFVNSSSPPCTLGNPPPRGPPQPHAAPPEQGLVPSLGPPTRSKTLPLPVPSCGYPSLYVLFFAL